MDYLGKIDRVPLRTEGIEECSRKFYETITFSFEDEDEFNSFFFKTNKLTVYSAQDRNNGKYIVEDSSKSKYIIDLEQVNYYHASLSADICICGIKKIK